MGPGLPARVDRKCSGRRVEGSDGKWGMAKREVQLTTLPFLIPGWAAAQVLLPGRIFVRRGARLDRRLLAHELVHVAQLESLGLFRYWLDYLVYLLRCGYREHPLELDAVVRSAEPEFLQWADQLLVNRRASDRLQPVSWFSRNSSGSVSSPGSSPGAGSSK